MLTGCYWGIEWEGEIWCSFVGYRVGRRYRDIGETFVEHGICWVQRSRWEYRVIALTELE